MSAILYDDTTPNPALVPVRLNLSSRADTVALVVAEREDELPDSDGYYSAQDIVFESLPLAKSWLEAALRLVEQAAKP